MPLQVSVSLGYKDLFDDYENISLKELVADIPSINALEIITHFQGQIHTLERNQNSQLTFFKIWLSRLPNEIVLKVQNFINDNNGQISKYNFINNVSCLILIQEIILNYNYLPTVTSLNPDQELNLFKSYLYCSQKWQDNQMSGFNYEKPDDEEYFIKLLIPTQIPYQEILGLKDFRLQFIKAIYFFKFCEKDEIFKTYLTLFLEEYNLKNWKDYLINIVSLYVRKFEHLSTPTVISIDPKYQDIINFLESLCVNLESFEYSQDFLALREKPVFRRGESEYIFLSLNFLVDKIYQGIQFDFGRVLSNKKAKFKGKEIKTPVQFMSIFSNEFSESGLFYAILHYTFGRSQYKLFSGTEMKKFLVDGEPDFYIRDKAKVYLFEYKNIFINSKVKHSYDFKTIVDEIYLKLVENEKKSPKGVTQLVNVIEKLQNDEFSKFDYYDYSKTIIYPIIICIDPSFNLAGINYILNKEFRRILKEKDLSHQDRIKDLTLIDLDTFIKFQDLFRNKKLKINNCLNEYSLLKNKKTNKLSNLFDHFQSFDSYIHNKTRIMEYDSPKMFLDEILSMIPNDDFEAQKLDSISSN